MKTIKIVAVGLVILIVGVAVWLYSPPGFWEKTPTLPRDLSGIAQDLCVFKKACGTFPASILDMQTIPCLECGHSSKCQQTAYNYELAHAQALELDKTVVIKSDGERRFLERQNTSSPSVVERAEILCR